MVVPHTAQEQERLEILQDVIDRMLYLPPDKHKEFMEYLNTLFTVFKVEYQVIDGIRIYNIKPNQHAAQ